MLRLGFVTFVAAVLPGLSVAGDEHGDTRLTSTPIEYGERVAGSIDSAGDIDMFRIDLHAQATLDMRSGGKLDTVGTLYDGSGATVATDDDSGSGLNFRLRETLGAGVHYVAVQSDVDTGDYRLIVRIERADDHGNTSATSTLLRPGASLAGTIDAADDRDVFRIDVDAPLHLTVATGGPADTTGELRDGSDRVLATADEGGNRANFRIARNVEAGPHYIHVTADQPSAYYIEANLQALKEGGADDTDQVYPDASAAVLFGEAISQQIVQARCLRCHVAGGESGNTRLVFVSSLEQDHATSNLGVLRAFVLGDGNHHHHGPENAMLVLDKMSATVSHGGGMQVEAGSEDYLNMQALLARIVAEGGEARPGTGIGDQTVEAGKELHVAVVAGQPLDALSGDPCIATATVEGDGVRLTGRIAGTTTVSVTTDSSAEAATFRLDVQPPQVPGWALPRAAPEDQDVTPCAVAGVLDLIYTDTAVQSALLLRGSAVVGERYADGYDVASLGTSWSVAKSLYSAAIGTAIDHGYIASLEQEASDFLHEWNGSDRERITIRNILEMRAGLSDPESFFKQADQTRAALAVPRSRAPGGRFEYSNATSQLFEPLLRRATGMNAHDWLWQTILEPIGVHREAIGMWLDPTGVNPMTYCCLDMRPDDFARFGVLFANGGVWRDERLISASYVRESLAAQSPFYGFQWWVMNAAYLVGRQPPIEVAAAHGLEGQHIYVWPDADVVLVVLTKMEHDRKQGYVLSLTNFPSTCAARNTCPGAEGKSVPTYDDWALLQRLAAMR